MLNNDILYFVVVAILELLAVFVEFILYDMIGFFMGTGNADQGTKVTEYINFSGLSTLTRDNGYYIDTSHFNAYMGDIMISVLEGETSEYEYEGFGYHVTKDNADELVEILKRQL